MSVRAGSASLPPELSALVAENEDPAEWGVGGLLPLAVLAPGSIAEAGTALRAAGRAGLAVAPLGGGTARAQLDPPRRPFVALLTRKLSGIVEHTAADLTVVVQAGTTLAALDAALGAHRQRLPLTVPAPERSTVGGLIAADRSGPLRLGHGTVRDYLIGIAVLDPGGNLVRAGGRVVKNVAGYDLMKLHAGARGTLGLIVEAAFKVKPVPDEVLVLSASATPAVAETIRRRLRAEQVPAVVLELLMGKGAADELVIGLEGVASEIAWQATAVQMVLAAAGAGAGAQVTGEPARERLRSLVEFGAKPEGGLVLRAAVLPSRIGELVERFLAAAPEARLAAGVGTGIVRLFLRDPAAPDIVRRLRSVAADLGGHAVVHAMPPAWEGDVDRFGVEPDPIAIRLKNCLDPQGLFLPGAYLGLGAGAEAGAPAR
jgi:glycolate oxidase FAD binding subunit